MCQLIITQFVTENVPFVIKRKDFDLDVKDRKGNFQSSIS